MSRMAHSISAGALLAIAVCAPATSAAQARIPDHVRVTTQSERIMRWLGPQTDVILVVNQGTALEVLDFDQEKGWYWVVLPPDLHGSRKVGWIRASSVESYAARTSRVPPPAGRSEIQRDDVQAPALVPTSTTIPATPEDNVSITVRHDPSAAGSADAAGAKKSYTF